MIFEKSILDVSSFTITKGIRKSRNPLKIFIGFEYVPFLVISKKIIGVSVRSDKSQTSTSVPWHDSKING